MATDPDHYDFVGERCVKDLKIEALRFGADDGGATFEVYFRHNCWKREEDLRITYGGLSSLRMDDDPEGKRGGRVVTLDELWVPADCAKREVGE